LEALGAGREHAFRTRVHVTDLEHRPSIARAYADAFTELNPDNSVVGTRRFKCPESLVEIEADALVPHGWLRNRGADPQIQSPPVRDAE
jgi:enamine deaminase RidA (YjgF/YER057c/UK114 family)